METIKKHSFYFILLLFAGSYLYNIFVGNNLFLAYIGMIMAMIGGYAAGITIGKLLNRIGL